jgi:hypothetical protein
LNEEPLACDVFETRLDDTQFHSTTRMHQNLGEPGRAASADLSVDAFSEVDDTGPDGEPPALVAETVIGGIEGEDLAVRWFSGVTHETSSGVSVEANHEEERKVVRVPERLKALVANFVVSSRVHEDHEEQHEVSSDTTSLGIVDI